MFWFAQRTHDMMIQLRETNSYYYYDVMTDDS